MNQSSTEQIVRLLSSYQEQIYRYIFALLPHEQDAKDIVQETCLALCRKFEEYDPERPFLPWAYRFAYLEVLKHRERRPRNGVMLSDDVIELLAHERDVQREMLDARLRALEDCLHHLPAADMELIRGRYHADVPIERLALQLATSQRTLFRNLDRVRRLLFDCISRRVATEELA